MQADAPASPAAPLTPRLRRRLRDRLGLTGPLRWDRLSGGRGARTFLLTHRADRFVLKIARAGGGGPLFPIRPQAEAVALHILGPRGLSAALIDHFQDGPTAVTVCRYLSGTDRTPPGPAFARLLRRLHDTPRTGLHRLPSNPPAVQPLLARAKSHLAAHPDRTALDRTLSRACLLDLAPRRRLAVRHGDPVPGNVLATPCGPRLIDWQCACLGDPVRDLALALTPAMQVIHGLPPLGPGQIGAFMAAYGDAAAAAALHARAPLFHAEMIGHALWRLDRGDRAYAPALEAEIAALAACARTPGRV